MPIFFERYTTKVEADSRLLQVDQESSAESSSLTGGQLPTLINRTLRQQRTGKWVVLRYERSNTANEVI
jgi:hypothetical protein